MLFRSADTKITVLTPPVADTKITVLTPPVADTKITVLTPPVADTKITVLTPPVADTKITVLTPPVADTKITVLTPPVADTKITVLTPPVADTKITVLTPPVVSGGKPYFRLYIDTRKDSKLLDYSDGKHLDEYGRYVDKDGYVLDPDTGKPYPNSNVLDYKDNQILEMLFNGEMDNGWRPPIRLYSKNSGFAVPYKFTPATNFSYKGSNKITQLKAKDFEASATFTVPPLIKEDAKMLGLKDLFPEPHEDPAGRTIRVDEIWDKYHPGEEPPPGVYSTYNYALDIPKSMFPGKDISTWDSQHERPDWWPNSVPFWGMPKGGGTNLDKASKLDVNKLFKILDFFRTKP